MIRIDIEKAKGVAHDRRRSARDGEFAPLDAQMAARIPGIDEAAIEAERQAIRDRYADLQVQIDKAKSIDALSAIVADISKA